MKKKKKFNPWPETKESYSSSLTTQPSEMFHCSGFPFNSIPPVFVALIHVSCSIFWLGCAEVVVLIVVVLRTSNKCVCCEVMFAGTQQVASLPQVADTINRFKYRCTEHSFYYTYTYTQCPQPLTLSTTSAETQGEAAFFLWNFLNL